MAGKTGMGKQDTRLLGLDFIRFLCALSILLFHYCYRGMLPDSRIRYQLDIGILPDILAYSFLGVELFFVISGFVILNSALHKTPKDFFVARALRIYPAFLICMTITFLVERYVSVNHPDILSPSVTEYLGNLTMLNSFFGIDSMDGVYWTLVYELIFYGWVFLLMLFRQLKHFEIFIMVGLVASFATTFSEGQFVRLLMPGYFSFFALGSLFFLNHLHGPSRRRLLLIGAAYLLSLRRVYYVCMEFQSADVVIHPAVAMALETLLLLGFVWIIRNPQFFRRAALWMLLGNLTYPLYLIHQHIGYIILRLYAGTMNPYLLVTGVSLLMIAAAAIIYRFGEVPLRKVLRRIIARVPMLQEQEKRA